jgi:hypothetical protein
MPQHDHHDDYARVHITLDFSGLAPVLTALIEHPILKALIEQRAELRQITNDLKELKKMSGQALTDLATQRTVIDDLGTSFSTFVTQNDAQIQALKDQITNAGGTVDPAIDEAIVANTTALQATLDTLHQRLGTAQTPSA